MIKNKQLVALLSVRVVYFGVPFYSLCHISWDQCGWRDEKRKREWTRSGVSRTFRLIYYDSLLCLLFMWSFFFYFWVQVCAHTQSHTFYVSKFEHSYKWMVTVGSTLAHADRRPRKYSFLHVLYSLMMNKSPDFQWYRIAVFNVVAIRLDVFLSYYRFFSSATTPNRVNTRKTIHEPSMNSVFFFLNFKKKKKVTNFLTANGIKKRKNYSHFWFFESQIPKYLRKQSGSHQHCCFFFFFCKSIWIWFNKRATATEAATEATAARKIRIIDLKWNRKKNNTIIERVKMMCCNQMQKEEKKN